MVSRGYVSTREGIDALRWQLYAEAVRRGLHQAQQVLVIADGAGWIWNLAEDRFPQARQQLDFIPRVPSNLFWSFPLVFRTSPR